VKSRNEDVLANANIERNNTARQMRLNLDVTALVRLAKRITVKNLALLPCSRNLA
jgi:hypothetical protein